MQTSSAPATFSDGDWSAGGEGRSRGVVGRGRPTRVGAGAGGCLMARCGGLCSAVRTKPTWEQGGGVGRGSGSRERCVDVFRVVGV